MSDKLSRRHFFKVSGGIAAGAGVVAGVIPDAALAASAADAGNTVLPYPRKPLGHGWRRWPSDRQSPSATPTMRRRAR